ncbi:hypothetical protein SH139x_005512 [Planctomycetaceae bacterium SH139]
MLAATLLISSRDLSGDQPAAEEPAAGFLMLRGDYAVLKGSVRQEPDRVILIQHNGEIRFPRSRVACWANNLAGLYQFQIDHLPANDIYEHSRLATWCLRHNYLPGAEAQLQAITKLDPNYPQLPLLKAELDLVRTQLERPTQSTAERDTAVRQVGHTLSLPAQTRTDPGTSSESPPVSENLSSRLIREFAVTIQPLLNNRCATAACHGNGSQAAFQFRSNSIGAARPSQAITLANLEEVVKWINSDQPLNSPLLVQAQQAHGGTSEAPLEGRTKTTENRLRDWIEQVAAASTNPNRAADNWADQSLQSPTPLARAGTGQSESGQSGTGQSGTGIAGTGIASTTNAANSQSPPPQTPRSRQATTVPVRLPRLDDPFDPQLFNRKMHPHKRADKGS